jgi:hypothetical protein
MKKFTAILIFVLALCQLSFTPHAEEEKQKVRLLEIAGEYLSYSTVQAVTLDHRKQMEWTISLCAQYKPGNAQNPPASVYHSDSIFFSTASPAVSPHGNKLYQLFVKNYSSYAGSSSGPQPDGQVVAKETWTTRQVDSGSFIATTLGARKNENDGKWYIPDRRSQLFIMYKEPESPDNDKGWVYGIVDLNENAALTAVVNHGKLSNCISCHVNTKYDRMFGKVRSDSSPVPGDRTH